MAFLLELENKYKVDLAMVVMKIMVKSLALRDLSSYFVSELSMTPEQAGNLTRELKEKLLAPVADYLGLSIEKRAWDLDKDINILIKEAGLVLPSVMLVNRFKTVLVTYLKGVRSKIDTRATLGKEINQGGLNFSPAEIDRILKICATHKFSNLEISALPEKLSPPPLGRLDKIIKQAEKLGVGEYDLKKSLAERNLLPLKAENELPASKAQLDLPAGRQVLGLPLAQAQVKSQPQPQPQIQPKSNVIISKAHPTAVPISQGISVNNNLVSAPVKSINEPISATVAATLGAVAAASIAGASAISTVAPNVVSPIASLAKGAAVVSGVANALQKITQPPKKVGFFSRLFKGAAKNSKQIKVTPISNVTVALINSSAPAGNAPILKPVVPSRPQPTPRLATADIRPTQVNPSRPKLHDVRSLPKVMGPIEELQFLDLVNFRRLGKTPPEISTRIFSKIKLLEKDGYDKMVAGVKAWRQSPVNRLYLRIGQEAIAKGLSIKDAAVARQQANQEFLSWEELEAIVNLNSRLTF